MKLSKSDALLVYTLLFNQTSSLGSSFDDQLDSILDSIFKYLTDEDSEAHDSSEENSDETNEEDEDASEDADNSEEDSEQSNVQVEDYISPLALEELSSANVTSPAGDEVSLEFEKSPSDSSTIDALLDGGTVIIEGVNTIKLTEKSVELHDGSEWHIFECKRIPKQWRKALDVSVVYGIE